MYKQKFNSILTIFIINMSIYMIDDETKRDNKEKLKDMWWDLLDYVFYTLRFIIDYKIEIR